MNTSQKTLYRRLLAELADIERQQEDRTLPHSDQQLLDQAWEDVTNQIDELEEIVGGAPPENEEDWRDARVALEEDFPSYPLPAAPAPKSVTLQTGISKKTGKLMTLMPDGRWVPAPPLPFGLPSLSATRRPPPIEIPVWTGSPSMAPPPPRPGGVSICNCDSDGECDYCKEEREAEELERWNNMKDDREGCDYCAGCQYCQEGGGYDGADEV